MAKGIRPPPLNLTPPASARNSSHSSHASLRLSLKQLATSSSAAPTWNHRRLRYSPRSRSVFEEDDDWAPGKLFAAARMAADLAHILTCLLLLLIMAFFLNYMPGSVRSRSGPAAVVLITFLALDMLLDFNSIGRYDKKWRGWALALRLVLGTAYICVFGYYVSEGHAFPRGYSYWDLPERFASPLVYAFVWTIACWDLVYCGLNYRQASNEYLRYRRFAIRLWANPRTFGHGPATPKPLVDAGFDRSNSRVDIEAAMPREPLRVVGHGASASVVSIGAVSVMTEVRVESARVPKEMI